MSGRPVKPLKIRSARRVSRKADACCAPAADAPPCCGPSVQAKSPPLDERVPGFLRWRETAAGRVAEIATSLTFADRAGAWKARWGIGRMTYIVPAGLYVVGEPDRDAPVVVTANYKMSYDLVRQALAGRDVWLLVLETYGVNVWCAAGKGTFGTGELVRRIEKTRLAELVAHRRLVLPLLGAAGVRAVEVRERTGFDVRFATVRCADLPQYLDNDMTATAEMRRLTFTTRERLVLIPVELVSAAKVMVPVALLLGLIGGLSGGWHLATVLLPAVACTGAVIAGTSAVPLLLPWLPTRSFAVKGAFCGLLWAALLRLAVGGTWSLPGTLLSFLALPAIAAYHGLNFTGSTPYTSRSGVKKEMRYALPVAAGALAVGIAGWLAGTVFAG